MDDTLAKRAQLQKMIQEDEENWKQSLHRLTKVVKKKTSLGTYVAKRPGRFFAGAVVAGIVLGILFYRRWGKKR